MMCYNSVHLKPTILQFQLKVRDEEKNMALLRRLILHLYIISFLYSLLIHSETLPWATSCAPRRASVACAKTFEALFVRSLSLSLALLKQE